MTTMTQPTCEANTGARRATTWGFEPIRCSQRIGLITLTDAAGITHYACARFGHRTDIVRRFGETVLPEEPAEPDWTLHGSLGLGSPWTRGLFPSEMRADVEESIPAGFRIDVTAVAGKPGPWRVRAVSTERLGPDGHPLEVIPWTLTRDPHGLVAAFALRLG